jgi:hypothetical protein
LIAAFTVLFVHVNAQADLSDYSTAAIRVGIGVPVCAAVANFQSLADQLPDAPVSGLQWHCAYFNNMSIAQFRDRNRIVNDNLKRFCRTDLDSLEKAAHQPTDLTTWLDRRKRAKCGPAFVAAQKEIEREQKACIGDVWALSVPEQVFENHGFQKYLVSRNANDLDPALRAMLDQLSRDPSFIAGWLTSILQTVAPNAPRIQATLAQARKNLESVTPDANSFCADYRIRLQNGLAVQSANLEQRRAYVAALMPVLNQ